MRDQTTEQEKLLLQIRNVFFDKQKSKFPSGYDPRRRGVLCWLTSGTEKKEVKINVCVYILDIFCRMFSWLRVYTGPEVWKSKNCQAALQMVVCKKTKKWCTKMVYWKNNTHFYENCFKRNEEKFWDDHDPQPIMEPKQGQPSSSTDRLEWCGASHFQGRGEVCLKGSF